MRKERGKQIPEKSFISRTVLILLVCAALLLGGCASGSGNGTVDQNSRGQDSPGTEAAEGTGNGMDTYYFMWMDVGCAYFEPLIDYDIYADAAGMRAMC